MSWTQRSFHWRRWTWSMAVEKEAEKRNSDSGKESRREQNVEFVWACQYSQHSPTDTPVRGAVLIELTGFGWGCQPSLYSAPPQWAHGVRTDGGNTTGWTWTEGRLRVVDSREMEGVSNDVIVWILDTDISSNSHSICPWAFCRAPLKSSDSIVRSLLIEMFACILNIISLMFLFTWPQYHNGGRFFVSRSILTSEWRDKKIFFMSILHTLPTLNAIMCLLLDSYLSVCK